jgi:tellurite methyltransferase
MLAASADLAGARVLDLGCGEGQNAVFLAQRGCEVEAWDISEAALANAERNWRSAPVSWKCKDATNVREESRQFDIVLAYGLFHCLPQGSISEVISHIKRITVTSGYNIAVCFNDRKHINLGTAHPSFSPTCLPHNEYLLSYGEWNIIHESDTDLTERHPTNNIEHTHSMTRMLAQRAN